MATGFNSGVTASASVSLLDGKFECGMVFVATCVHVKTNVVGEGLVGECGVAGIHDAATVNAFVVVDGVFAVGMDGEVR